MDEHAQVGQRHPDLRVHHRARRLEDADDLDLDLVDPQAFADGDRLETDQIRDPTSNHHLVPTGFG